MAELLVVVFPVVQFDVGLQPIVDEAIFQAHGANHLFTNGSPDSTPLNARLDRSSRSGRAVATTYRDAP